MNKYEVESLIMAILYALVSTVVLAFSVFIITEFEANILIYTLIYLLLLIAWYFRNRKKAEEFSYTVLTPQ